MTSRRAFRLLPILALAMAAAARADVTPASIFRDGLVLQREKPVPVWGGADAGEKVSVSFGSQTVSTTADADGRWRVALRPMEAAASPRELTIKGANTVVIRDVLVGEVWLASGQSNMEWPISYVIAAKAETAGATDPLLRQFKVERASAAAPQTTLEGSWAQAQPDTVGQFTAVGYYFGRSLREKLRVPVAIINSSWGGTGIDPWIPAEAQSATPELAAGFAKSQAVKRPAPAEVAAYQTQRAAWEKARDDAKKTKQPFSTPAPKAPANLPGTRTPAGLNNAMVAPLAPFALRGVIWYQGEANAAHASGYALRQRALVRGLRAQFAQGDLPFYWVQLPNFDFANRNDSDWSWAKLREAQTAALDLPGTGQAVTIDVGEAKQLHPKTKKPVGERLALLALARAYGQKSVIDSGPVFAAARREGAIWRVAFAPLTSPLKPGPAGLTGFELAGEDKVFHPAQARIDGAQVLVASTAVPEPVALRYAFRNAPEAGLFNAAGLPAGPFRTDDW